MYIPDETLPTEQRVQIDELTDADFKDGAKTLTQLKIEAYEQNPKNKCVKRLQELARRSPPSPVTINSVLYDFVVQNNGESFEKETGTLIFRLSQLLRKK